jgi:hypothetical protein
VGGEYPKDKENEWIDGWVRNGEREKRGGHVERGVRGSHQGWTERNKKRE